VCGRVYVRCPSLCPIYRLLQQRAAGLLLQPGGQQTSIDGCMAGAQKQRAAAKTNTVKFTATEAEHRPVKIVVNSFKLVKLVV